MTKYHSPLQVWVVDLKDRLKYQAAYGECLCRDEHVRAQKFQFEDDRSRFIVTRSVLRQLLARLLHRSPEEIEFSTQTHGKPMLANEKDVCFNVSHSADIALIGLSQSGAQVRLGVDVELMRTISDMSQIAARCLSPEQFQEFEALPECQQFEAFYRFWTRKEAVIKADGIGMSLPLDSFDVSFLNDRPKLIRACERLAPSEQWTISEIPVPSRYCAALAIDQPGCELYFNEWNFD